MGLENAFPFKYVHFEYLYEPNLKSKGILFVKIWGCKIERTSGRMNKLPGMPSVPSF